MDYSRDYGKLPGQLLPGAYMQGGLAALQAAMLSFLQERHAALIGLRDSLRYKIGHSSQKCYLQAACNYAVDPLLRRVEIWNEAYRDSLPVLLYADVYERPVLLGSAILHGSAYYTAGDFDFVVFVPFLMSNAQRWQLMGVLDFYKLAGMRYRIMTY
jgi:hypothetical protein